MARTSITFEGQNSMDSMAKTITLKLLMHRVCITLHYRLLPIVPPSETFRNNTAGVEVLHDQTDKVHQQYETNDLWR